MKKTLGKFIISIIISLLIIGCQNPSSMDKPSHGNGYFSISFGEENAARTILPAAVQSDFVLYSLDFFWAGTGNLVLTIDRDNSNFSNNITLPTGTLDLNVTAYLDSGKTQPAAWGSIIGIIINDGLTTNSIITLTGNIEGGEGSFSWDINYPATVTEASMTITQLTGNTETLIDTLDFTGINKIGTRKLDTGYYRVALHLLNNDNRCTERSEILHIYQNMNSIFAYTFDISSFHNIRVKKIVFNTASTVTTDFCHLNSNDIFLAKVNTSTSMVIGADTGKVLSSVPSPAPGMFPPLRSNNNVIKPNNNLAPQGRQSATEFHANPLPKPGIKTSSFPGKSLAPPVGSTKLFYLETYLDSRSWLIKTATLMASGTYSDIWVLNDNIAGGASANKLDNAKAQTLADKFDLIYPLVTNLLGFENGGGPGGNGGVDGDKKIQILVYDILDYANNVAAAGYFWGIDFYPNDFELMLYGLRSNQAEMFYIDASQFLKYPMYIYSTLIHEFQHMINFSRKSWEKGKISDTWYNEMLSMMTEDIISPLIGVSPSDPDHSIQVRMPVFNLTYNWVPITNWATSDYLSAMASYAKGFAFGAYLLRNYGGANLLKSILENNTTDIDSITAALKEFSPELNFQKSLSRLGEAMVFGSYVPDGHMSFNKTVTKTVSGYNGTHTYTTQGFDIWNDFINELNNNIIEPRCYNLDQETMVPHSLVLHTDSSWNNKSGSFSIELQKPNNPNVELYLMVK
ncbi:MAG: hypothetical protein FWH35_03450 [Treponema sp.]|nr:hypothetical protein [Treponema sp.]